MRDRHLAGTKSVQLHLVLHVDEARVHLCIDVRCRNADLEFVLQSLGEGFCNLHDVNLLPELTRREPGSCQCVRRGAWAMSPEPASVVRRTRSGWKRALLNFSAQTRAHWCGRRDSNPHNFRHWNLNPARLPVPPRPRSAIVRRHSRERRAYNMRVVLRSKKMAFPA